MTAVFEIEEPLVFERRSAGKAAFRLSCRPIRLPLSPADNRLPILGVTGYGKSTFLNLLAGFEFPSQGRIRWSFHGIPNLDPAIHRTIGWGPEGPDSAARHCLRRWVFGFACQNSPLLPYLTVAENLVYPLRLRGQSKAAAFETVTERLQSWLVEGEDPAAMLSKYPMELSGGQRQRVALLKAVIHDPLVLVADEPTGSLDAETRNQIMTAIERWLQGCLGRMFVWVTHYEEDPIRYGTGACIRVTQDGVRWCPRGLLEGAA